MIRRTLRWTLEAPVSRSLFFASILIPGFGYVWHKQFVSFAFVFATVLVTYGVYGILLGSVSTIMRSHSAWHILAVVGVAVHGFAAVHSARGGGLR